MLLPSDLDTRIVASDHLNSLPVAKIVRGVDDQLLASAQTDENFNGGPEISSQCHFLDSQGAARSDHHDMRAVAAHQNGLRWNDPACLLLT